MRISVLHYHNAKKRLYKILIFFVCLIALFRKILTHFGLLYLKYRPDYEINIKFRVQKVIICFTNPLYITYLNIPQIKKKWEIILRLRHRLLKRRRQCKMTFPKWSYRIELQSKAFKYTFLTQFFYFPITSY